MRDFIDYLAQSLLYGGFWIAWLWLCETTPTPATASVLIGLSAGCFLIRSFLKSSEGVG